MPDDDIKRVRLGDSEVLMLPRALLEPLPRRPAGSDPPKSAATWDAGITFMTLAAADAEERGDHGP